MENVLLITLRSDVGGGPKHVYDLARGIDRKNISIAAPVSPPYGKKYKETIT